MIYIVTLRILKLFRLIKLLNINLLTFFKIYNTISNIVKLDYF